MDPKACLQLMAEALQESNFDDAANAAQDLGEWFHKGGFRIVIPGLAANLSNEALAAMFDHTSMVLRAMFITLQEQGGSIQKLETLPATV